MSAPVPETPMWLKNAVATFVESAPPLQLEDGFDGWPGWLEAACNRALWRPQKSWRLLMDTCKASSQVRGVAALSQTRNDIIVIIISAVYRNAEEARRRRVAPNTKLNEHESVQQVRLAISKQRLHDPRALTLSRLIDFSFRLSAYVDCCIDECGNDERHKEQIRSQVEEELGFLDMRATVENLGQFSLYMEGFMQSRKWLPWYEEVPKIRNRVVIEAREAACLFCDGVPGPQMNPKSGLAGLLQRPAMSSSGIDVWLISLLEPKFLPKWEGLTTMYSTALSTGHGEEEALLEELSRRVVGTSLESLLERADKTDPNQATLADVVPEILSRQSVRTPGNLTFRMLLELYIYLSVFRTHLTEFFYSQELPVIEKIHTVVALFGQAVDRIAEIRYILRPEQNMNLMQWSIQCIDRATVVPPYAQRRNPQECMQYKKAAIGAVLGRVFIRFSNRNSQFGDFGPQGLNPRDTLTYAAIIAEWDPALAAKIIDAAMGIEDTVRQRFLQGNGEGVDLYIYRRILVCDAAKSICQDNAKAAGAIMAKLHPVWEVCSGDKAIGSVTPKGLDFMRQAVERGNFEAATFYGLMLSSASWVNVRRAVNMEQQVEEGIRLILQALESGDYSASIDLASIIISGIPDSVTKLARAKIVDEIMNKLRAAANESPVAGLFLGYVYSLGGCGEPANCEEAAASYERVLSMTDVTAATRAHAINNLAILLTMGKKAPPANDTRAAEYLVMASLAGNVKAKTNLAAMYCYGVVGIKRSLPAAESVYRDFFASTRGEHPIAVIQKAAGGKDVEIAQVRIDPERQEAFCKAVGTSGAPANPASFGEVLQKETLPCTNVAEMALSV